MNAQERLRMFAHLRLPEFLKLRNEGWSIPCSLGRSGITKEMHRILKEESEDFRLLTKRIYKGEKHDTK